MGKRIISLQEAQSITNDDYLVIDNQSGGTKKVSAGFINDIVSDVQVDGTSVVDGGVAEIDLSGKQDTLTAGSNIQIAQDGTISATDTTYTAGTNVQINNNVISATDTTYTAGTNVQIDNGVISATDTTYTAGTNVQINNGVISATDTTYSAFGGATAGADGSSGLVPQPLIADKDKFLKGDGTWDTIQPGASALDDLTNVDITSPTNGQVLKYDSTNQEWVNANESGGGGASAVADLTDVNLTSLANGQILKYDSTSQKWINSDESGGGNLSYETVFSGSKSTSAWSSPLVFNEFDVTACDIIRITAAHDSYSYTWLIDTSLIPLTGGNTLHIYGEVYCNRDDTELQMYVSTGHTLEVSKIESVISGGGGASVVADLTDVDLTNLSNGQILKYDATNQKWINADEGGGSTEVRRYLGQLCPRVTGTDSHISQSSNGSYGQTVWYSWGAFSDNTITTWGVPDSGAAWVDNHDNSPWISYHFDEPRYFTELTIDCGSNYGGSFTGSIYIEASNDGTAWVDIGGGVKTINAPYQSIGTNTYALDDTDTWEYIRIRGTQSFWILNTPSCFIQSINVYGGDIISKSKSDIVVVSRTDNTNGYAWLTPCDASGNALKPSEVTLLSIFAEADMSGAPPYYNGLNVCVDTDRDRYCCKLYNMQTGGYAQDGTYSVDYTVAYIPNSGGSSGCSSSSHTYSTTEQKVGTWIDGSDLYERTINITTVSFTATQDMDISNYIDSTEVVHESIGMFNYTYQGANYATPINGRETEIVYWDGAYKLRLNFGSGSLDSMDAYITIRYTKVATS